MRFLAVLFLLAAASSAYAEGDCHALAKSRLGLYVHSDMYPLSDKEKDDALNALYEECMKPYRASTPGQTAQVAKEEPPVKSASPTPAVPLETKTYPEPVKETGLHQAVAAPVSGVSMGPVSDTPPVALPTNNSLPPPTPAPQESVLQAHSPFKVAKQPPPEVAARIQEASHPKRLPATPEHPTHIAKKPPAQSLPATDSAADPTGRRQLQNILNQ